MISRMSGKDRLMAGWTSLRQLLELEIAQRIQEGCRMDRLAWQERLQACGDGDTGSLESLYRELQALEPGPDSSFHEPAGLEAILKSIPARKPRPAARIPGEREIFDRLRGGWMGRCCGLALGLPFQNEPFTRHRQNRQRREIERWLKGADAWPLDSYVPSSSRVDVHGLRLASLEYTRENLQGVGPDPNINFMLVALKTLEEAGTDFQTGDLARSWFSLLTYDVLPPAETQAYLNMLRDENLAGGRFSREDLDQADWTAIATWHNPYRESVGARCRSDLYGYLCPGHPARAAEMAWRDARMSHVKNGIYSAMFTAAMIAKAYTCGDPASLVQTGLSLVPKESRLAHAVRAAIRLRQEREDWAGCWDEIHAQYFAHDTAHSIPNTVICVLALLYGEGDFAKSICTAVSAGLSPAANGATVGSILGLVHGARALPARWTDPLKNSFRTGVKGYEAGTLSDGAARCMDIIKKGAHENDARRRP